jgi:hypothetical protein
MMSSRVVCLPGVSPFRYVANPQHSAQKNSMPIFFLRDAAPISENQVSPVMISLMTANDGRTS